MRHRVIALTLPFALSLSGLLATQLAAQDTQDTSVAEAARRAQEQKKSTSKPAKVITNDSLPATSSPDPANPAVTPPAPSPEAATQPATTEAGARDAAAADAKTPAVQGEAAAQPDNAPANPEVAALKRRIADQQKQVDLLLRLHSLDQDAFLSNPNHAKDEQGKAKLDAQQEEIHAKVAEVAALKVKLEAIAPGQSAKPAATKP